MSERPLNECRGKEVGDVIGTHEFMTHVLVCRRCDLHVDPTMVGPEGKTLDGDRETNAVHLVESMLRNLKPDERHSVLCFCIRRLQRLMEKP